MSGCAQHNLTALKYINTSKRKAHFIRSCPNSVIKSICECALNVIHGKVPLSKNLKKKLIPHKNSLRKLADRKVPLFKKRKILAQKGNGFLSFLLPAAISVISTLINGTR